MTSLTVSHTQPAPMRRETVFDINGLTVSYGKSVAVKDVSIDIYKNAITAMIGPTGSRSRRSDSPVDNSSACASRARSQSSPT